MKKFCTLILIIITTAVSAQETLKLEWPAKEKWKPTVQENAQMKLTELVRGKETLEKWTEMGNMTVIKGVKGVPVDAAMNMMFEQSKKNAPKSKLTFIEKDADAEHPWIIFTIESPEFADDKNPESQLWYIVQGDTALYTNFYAVKKATITEDVKTKWTAFFKTGKIVLR